MFVDNSGRRARLLRRCGTLLGVVCLGYAVVLGMAFMGWGISASPTELFPFGGRSEAEAARPAHRAAAATAHSPRAASPPRAYLPARPAAPGPPVPPTAVPSPSASAN